MGRCVTVAIVGLGGRGRGVYAQAAKRHPDKMKIVAVADIDPVKVRAMAEEYELPEKALFSSAEDMLAKERLADVMIIATQDRQHVEHAIPALEKGYHLLLEKPVSPDLEDCKRLLKATERCGRKVVVCHVLRYTPVYQKVKEILDSGIIGEIVTITANENVGWFHQAHSFVRGNWANSDETSPMILQKCCHDMDLYLWLADKTCKALSSFGNTYLFKEEKAPEGSTLRCTDECKVKETCPFNAEAIYMENRLIGYRRRLKEAPLWPLDIIAPGGVSEESVHEGLRTGRYGRCVYHCDNNVVDHQVVNMDMTDGSTMSFTMSGFTPDIARHASFMGTKGHLTVTLDAREPEKSKISLKFFDNEITEEEIDVMSLSDDFSEHGGGDFKMVEEFLDVISGERKESAYVTSLERSLESHYCALAAEYSRVRGGEVVDMDEFRK